MELHSPCRIQRKEYDKTCIRKAKKKFQFFPIMGDNCVNVKLPHPGESDEGVIRSVEGLRSLVMSRVCRGCCCLLDTKLHAVVKFCSSLFLTS